MPIATWPVAGDELLAVTRVGDAPLTLAQRQASLAHLLAHTPFRTVRALLDQFDEIRSPTGTRLVLCECGLAQFSLEAADDVRICGESGGGGVVAEGVAHDISLRAYLEVLYYSDEHTRPPMEICLRGTPVPPRDWTAFLHEWPRGKPAYSYVPSALMSRDGPAAGGRGGNHGGVSGGGESGGGGGGSGGGGSGGSESGSEGCGCGESPMVGDAAKGVVALPAGRLGPASVRFGTSAPLEELIRTFSMRAGSGQQNHELNERKRALEAYTGVFYYNHDRLILPLVRLPKQNEAYIGLKMLTTEKRLTLFGTAIVGVCCERFLVPEHNKAGYEAKSFEPNVYALGRHSLPSFEDLHKRTVNEHFKTHLREVLAPAYHTARLRMGRAPSLTAPKDGKAARATTDAATAPLRSGAPPARLTPDDFRAADRPGGASKKQRRTTQDGGGGGGGGGEGASHTSSRAHARLPSPTVNVIEEEGWTPRPSKRNDPTAEDSHPPSQPAEQPAGGAFEADAAAAELSRSLRWSPQQVEADRAAGQLLAAEEALVAAHARAVEKSAVALPRERRVVDEAARGGHACGGMEGYAQQVRESIAWRRAQLRELEAALERFDASCATEEAARSHVKGPVDMPWA